MTSIPRVHLKGTPRERGRQYGAQARELIHSSLAAYQQVFAHYAGWSWDQVLRHAARYREPIAAFSEDIIAEVDGLAEGAGLDVDAVLALNCRTEIMYAAVAEHAVAAASPLRGECSTLALLPSRAAQGHVLAGQNWDWLLHSAETIVCLEVERSDEPTYLTVVEAGLLAKFGVNSAGIAVLSNALVCSEDRGRPGVPYHAVLRALYDARTLPSAVRRVQAADRSSSANYLLVSRDGTAVSIEAAPGGPEATSLIFPECGVIAHTNHFVQPWPGLRALSTWESPDSPFRLARLLDRIETGRHPMGPEDVIDLLRDHANRPGSVCAHIDPTLPEIERSRTIASAVFDLTTGEIWLNAGQPCEVDYEPIRWNSATAAQLRPDGFGLATPMNAAGSELRSVGTSFDRSKGGR